MGYYSKLLKTALLPLALGFLTPAVSQTQADSIMAQCTFEFIGSHADDLKYSPEKEALTCDVLWAPLSQLGLTELEYDGDYPYQFAKFVLLATQLPKKAMRKKIKGNAWFSFSIDTLGSLTLENVEFRQYKSLIGETVPRMTDSLRCEIEQSFRQCIENTRKWTPISDLAGNKYPCKCRMGIEVGQDRPDRLVHNVHIEILLQEKYMPFIDDQYGNLIPQRLFLRKTYDERHEPQMRLMDKEQSEKKMELEKKAYKAAGIL